MRILHISHGGLPDPRIEKSALTMKKNGHETIFLGGRPIRWQSEGGFDDVHYLRMASSFRYALDPLVKRKWQKTIRDLKPDVVHAHNFTCARFLLGMDIPTVHDDHEYWSKRLFKYDTWGRLRRLQATPMIRNIEKWEHQLLESFPCITTNDNIAEEHRRFCKKVFIVRNFPSRRQVDFLKNPKDREGIVYVGNDYELAKFQHHRNLQGLKDIFDFDVIWGLPHNEMMERLTHYKLGHSAFRPIPFHKYIDANKNYEYLHAGLPLLISYIWGDALPISKHIIKFKDYDDIKQVIDEIDYPDPEDVMEYAHANFVWDIQEEKIPAAYKVAMNY